MPSAGEDMEERIDCADQAAVAELYGHMAKALKLKIVSIVKSDAVATEIMQDCFAKLWIKKPQFPHRKFAGTVAVHQTPPQPHH